MKALERAISIVGTQSALADAIGVKQQHISYWMTKGKSVPARFAILIEQATSGQVTRRDICPDVFIETTAA